MGARKRSDPSQLLSEDYTLIQNDVRKERQEVHPTSALYAADVRYSCCLSFPPSFHSSIVVLSVFNSANLVSVHFRCPFLLERKLCNSFFTYRNLLFSSSGFSRKGFSRKIFLHKSHLFEKLTLYNYIRENNLRAFSVHKNIFATKKANYDNFCLFFFGRGL